MAFNGKRAKAAGPLTRDISFCMRKERMSGDSETAGTEHTGIESTLSFTTTLCDRSATMEASQELSKTPSRAQQYGGISRPLIFSSVACRVHRPTFYSIHVRRYLALWTLVLRPQPCNCSRQQGKCSSISRTRPLFHVVPLSCCRLYETRVTRLGPRIWSRRT